MFVISQVYAARAPHAFTQCGVTCGQYSTVASGDTAYICTGHATGAWYVCVYHAIFNVSIHAANVGFQPFAGLYLRALKTWAIGSRIFKCLPRQRLA